MPSARQRPLTVEQEPFLLIRSFPCRYSSGYVIEEHTHLWSQLLYASSGAMTVHASVCSWMIPPGQAVFIPAGCRHSIRMWGSVDMRSLCFPVTLEAPALAGPDCRVLSVTPLLRELILCVIESGALDTRIPSQRRLAEVILDQMDTAPLLPLVLPMPTDPRALAVAGHVLASPSADDSLDELSQLYGAGRRTLERLFHLQTGISFGLWRQKVRLLESIRLLAEGKSVTQAAFDTGYTSVSAFIAAYKRTFGVTPGRR